MKKIGLKPGDAEILGKLIYEGKLIPAFEYNEAELLEEYDSKKASKSKSTTKQKGFHAIGNHEQVFA